MRRDIGELRNDVGAARRTRSLVNFCLEFVAANRENMEGGAVYKGTRIRASWRSKFARSLISQCEARTWRRGHEFGVVQKSANAAGYLGKKG